MKDPENYFVYVPENRLCLAWGCMALSSGYTKIPPGSQYPPARHPDDHHFNWARGRILRAYQIVHISAGRGRLEFGENRRAHRISAGDVFLLFPNVWHRYAPDDDSGWTEHWIECKGAAFDFVRDSGLLDPGQPVVRHASGTEAVFAKIHELARHDLLLNQPLVSTMGLQLLAQICQARGLPENGAARLVDRARMILMERCADQMAIEDVASELGVSYSYLRRLFKAETGMSAKQYQMGVRIQRACDLLDNTDKSIKEIAGLLGFNSAFHFSSQFHHAIGQSPTHWRARNDASA
ncbi:helix-turn-helix domain-containing protein [Roseibium sp. Sym1]|uniref:helix-turn-helix domain-containing protein n=1 Tax=Roseibium sp. Sym1 TaxID=3016006 RepID=UPI0022B5353E|nr:AraC family transcriptional regulator [Roseibium sp. Sym1]